VVLLGSMGFTHRWDITPFQGLWVCGVVWVDGLHPSLGYYALSGLLGGGVLFGPMGFTHRWGISPFQGWWAIYRETDKLIQLCSLEVAHLAEDPGLAPSDVGPGIFD